MIAVERVFERDAEVVNRVLNDPAVRPFVSGPIEEPLDATPLLADPRNFALFGEYGGIIFCMVQPGTYEAHTQVLEEGRGRWAIEMAQAAVMRMFCETDAVEIITRVPEGNTRALALTKAMHGVYWFKSAKGWLTKKGWVEADVFTLTVLDWLKTAPQLEERGHWFHEALAAEYRRLGKTVRLHPDDPIHDRYVGAAVEMIRLGQGIKGVMLYNRWAAFAGYAPVKFESIDPVIVNISDALLLVEGGTFKVIQCQ